MDFLGKIQPFVGKIGETNFHRGCQIIRGLSRVKGRLAEGMEKSRPKPSKSCRFMGNRCKSERPLSGLETCSLPRPLLGGRGVAKVNDRLAVWRHVPFLVLS